MRFVTMNDEMQRIFREYTMNHGTEDLFPLQTPTSLAIMKFYGGVSEYWHIVAEMFRDYQAEMIPLFYYDIKKDWYVIFGVGLCIRKLDLVVPNRLRDVLIYGWVGSELIVNDVVIRKEHTHDRDVSIQLYLKVGMTQMMEQFCRDRNHQEMYTDSKIMVSYENEDVKSRIYGIYDKIDACKELRYSSYQIPLAIRPTNKPTGLPVPESPFGHILNNLEESGIVRRNTLLKDRSNKTYRVGTYHPKEIIQRIREIDQRVQEIRQQVHVLPEQGAVVTENETTE